MTETTGLPYASQDAGQDARLRPRRAHGHAAGRRQVPRQTRNFDGTAIVIFQPAEEGGAGGKAMVDDGLMERWSIQEVYGMHNMPGIPVGQFAIRPGPLLAASDAHPSSTSPARAAMPRARTNASTRCSSAPYRDGAAVDRRAQRRSAQVGRRIDLQIPFRRGAQRNSGDGAPRGHRPHARLPKCATSSSAASWKWPRRPRGSTAPPPRRPTAPISRNQEPRHPDRIRGLALPGRLPAPIRSTPTLPR